MITCKEYAAKRKLELREIIQIQMAEKKCSQPTLTIIQVGNDFGSGKYVANKLKDCEEVGIVATHVHLPETITQWQFDGYVKAALVGSTGVIVQLPLPEHLVLNEKKIPLIQDVDGFREDSGFIPCTPKGVLSILDANEIELDGANVVIIGRGKLVGAPLKELMLERNATVTICHSHTKDLKRHCLGADIIVSAVGKPNTVTADMVAEGTVVIDVGVSRDENGKQIGDCDYPNLKDKCKFITPWVNGAGLMTRLSLVENVVESYLDSYLDWTTF